MTSDEVATIVRLALGGVDSTIKSQVSKHTISPRRQVHPYWHGKSYRDAELWLVIVITESNLGIAYSEEGYAAECGVYWGLVFLDQVGFGTSGAWYASLNDLLEDSGLF